MLRRALPLLALLACCQPAWAHKASDSYLSVGIGEDRLDGQWDIALRDLEYAIGLDANEDGAIAWGELRQKRQAVEAYAFSRLHVERGGKPCAIAPGDFLADHHTDGAYAVLRFELACPASGADLTLGYHLFFDLDPLHRGLLRVDYRGAAQTAVLSPDHDAQRIELGEIGLGATFLQYLREGISHIGFGYDHILFLMSLLLPAVLYRESGAWLPVASLRAALAEVLKIVTAFTLAHSITLSLATLDFIALPSRWVESAIALSVILAALNNLYPLVRDKRWTVAFAFGLVHGLGFANVLKDLGLPANALLLALVAFNLGVEVGQLGIVAGFLPLAHGFRRSPWYRKGFLYLGSTLIALLAAIWLAERAFNLKLISI
jgi:hypothetical protein